MGRISSTLAPALVVAAALVAGGCGGGSSSGTVAGTGTSADGAAPGSRSAPSAPGPGGLGKSSTPGGASPATGASEIAPELRRAIAEAAESGVAVRIPTELLAKPPRGADQAEVLRSPSDSYTLGLSARPGCRLKEDCTAAIFSGAGGGGELSGRRLRLAEGVEGAFEPGHCGPGCQFGTVEWIQEGNRYGVGVAGAPLGKLIDLANTAISSPPLGG